MRRAIVSGGNGFIGSSLIGQLVKMGVQVHALVNENHQRLDPILPPENIHVLKDGLNSAVELISRVQPDTIFHLAAVYAEPVSTKCVLSMVDGNLTLGVCMLFAASQMEDKPVFVNTGTYWQFDADSNYSPNTLYAATKHAFQNLLHFYRTRFGVASTTLVLYDTFGEADTRPKLWHRLTLAAPGETVLLSEGEQIIHLIHVEDTVEAFLRAAELLHEGGLLNPIYSVSSPTPRTLRSLVESLNDAGGLNLDLKWGALPYWDGQVFDPWVGEVLPGWEPRAEVLPALLRMIERRRPSATAVHELTTASGTD
jgi:nucleoside-diphosphate-sugar epimerase